MDTRTRLRQRMARGIAATGLAAALGLGLAVPAMADELDDRKTALSTEITEASKSAEESARGLESAAQNLKTSQSELAKAESALASTQEELSSAQAEHARLAEQLALAQADLSEADAAVVAGEAAIEGQRSMIGEIARSDYQQQHQLIGVAVLVEQGNTADMQSRMQVAETMMETNQSALQRLDEMQAQLADARAVKAAAEEAVATEEAAAQGAVDRLAELEATEKAQQQTLAAAVSANKDAQAAAQKQVAADESYYEELKEERESVNSRIAEREAEEKRKAAEKAKAEREAREAAAAKAAADKKAAAEKAAADKKAEQAKQAAAKKPKPAAKKSTSSSKSSTKKSSSGLAAPVNGRITSRYGMRVHPVTGVYKLHDGLDYGAACGTPIRAAADGRVTQRYYNAGYGNRIFVDHGRVNGKNTVTSYNHLSRYSAKVGDRVKQGEIIGYVGTTGYSTGCHLHLMVWQGGNLVNPEKVL